MVIGDGVFKPTLAVIDDATGFAVIGFGITFVGEIDGSIVLAIDRGGHGLLVG